MKNILYEVHIQSRHWVGRDIVYTFMDLKTGNTYFKSLPDYIKQIPVAFLNAHTRFVRDVKIDLDGEYAFRVSLLDNEVFVDFVKSSFQLKKEEEESLVGILW